jgi:hypothetical protein
MLDMDSNDLFSGFDPNTVAAIRAARSTEIAEQGKARAMKKAHRLNLRRAQSEAVLKEILPNRIEDGESWHVISHGDIDSLSYLLHLQQGVNYFDYVSISTWCMGSADLDILEGLIESGQIEELALYVGEIFPSQYSDEYARAAALSKQYGFRLVVARNHSKVMCACSRADDYYVVIESSANVNTNPRIEQTAVHASRELFDFYREFFDGLQTIDRRHGKP